MKTSYAKKLRKLRQSTGEPVIGTLVNTLAMKYIRTKGIVQANKHIIGAAIAYNIKKMMNWETKKQKIIAMVLPIPEKSNYMGVFPQFFNFIFPEIGILQNKLRIGAYS